MSDARQWKCRFLLDAHRPLEKLPHFSLQTCLPTVSPGEQLHEALLGELTGLGFFWAAENSPEFKTPAGTQGQGTFQFAWPRRRNESLLEHTPLCRGEGKSPGQFAQFHDPISPEPIGPLRRMTGMETATFQNKVSCFYRTDRVWFM